MLAARGLSLDRGGTTVLSEINVSVQPGDVIGLIGRNGAGKTSLMETLLGFHAPSRGSVEVFGRPAREMGRAEKQRLAFVAQGDELIHELTVEAQIHLVRSFYPGWDKAIQSRLCGAWGLSPSAMVGSLSAGQRQRLSVLMALCARPELLVMDEPAAWLDPLARREFLTELLAFAAGEGRAILVSSHIVADLDRLVGKVWLMARGKLVWHGPREAAPAAAGLAEGSGLEQVFERLVGD